MKWTTLNDVQRRLEKLWEKGETLRNQSLFPLKITVHGPTPLELSEDYLNVRDWVSELTSTCSKLCRIENQVVRNRRIGKQTIPFEIWIDTRDDALTLIGRSKDAEAYEQVVDQTVKMRPELSSWLISRPLYALSYAKQWHKILDVVAWMQQNPRPEIYLRQVSIPGVDSKFIEAHIGIVSELLKTLGHCNDKDLSRISSSRFCNAFGFRQKPLRARFRVLDPEMANLPTDSDQDLEILPSTFSQLSLAVSCIFVTENEINYLSFPRLPSAMVLFGGGYGFEALNEAKWLKNVPLHYWGDIDTHGFAMLNQFRARFPNARSILMDRTTLLIHQDLRGYEAQPIRHDLPNLDFEERALYVDICKNVYGGNLRLEQEHINFTWVTEQLQAVYPPGRVADLASQLS